MQVMNGLSNMAMWLRVPLTSVGEAEEPLANEEGQHTSDIPGILRG